MDEIVLEKIKSFWANNSHLRFFQVIDLLKFLYRSQNNIVNYDFFYLEDSEFIKFLEKINNTTEKRVK